MSFSPDYVRLVLAENFEDAKSLWLSPLMAIHEAHLAMLSETGIIALAEAQAIRAALERIDLDAVRATAYRDTFEDLFFHVDTLLVEACGPDTAGRLHTARSRNDIDMTMYRMGLRQWLLGLTRATLDLRSALIDVADAHRATVFPAHTHTQPAQPTTVAHYLLAAIEQLERDAVRLAAAYATTNQCPLGACAITGTGFPIDRERTSALLGFTRPTGNTYGSIAAADYVLESAAASATALVGLGRFVQDLLLWSTVEMGYLRLSDGFVQISSIMPQKRNPVALEHARALASKAVGQFAAIPQALHNTPFGDIVDTEDDLQPLVANAFRDATRAVSLVAAAMAAARFDVARMRTRAAESWVTITELADTLTRDFGWSFKITHAIAGELIRRAGHQQSGLATLLREVAATHGLEIDWTDERLAAVLSADHFVAVRRTVGGPAPGVTAQALDSSRRALARDRTMLTGWETGLASASAARAAAVAALRP